MSGPADRNGQDHARQRDDDVEANPGQSQAQHAAITAADPSGRGDQAGHARRGTTHLHDLVMRQQDFERRTGDRADKEKDEEPRHPLGATAQCQTGGAAGADQHRQIHH